MNNFDDDITFNNNITLQTVKININGGGGVGISQVLLLQLTELNGIIHLVFLHQI